MTVPTWSPTPAGETVPRPLDRSFPRMPLLVVTGLGLLAVGGTQAVLDSKFYGGLAGLALALAVAGWLGGRLRADEDLGTLPQGVGSSLAAVLLSALAFTGMAVLAAALALVVIKSTLLDMPFGLEPGSLVHLLSQGGRGTPVAFLAAGALVGGLLVGCVVPRGAHLAAAAGNALHQVGLAAALVYALGLEPFARYLLGEPLYLAGAPALGTALMAALGVSLVRRSRDTGPLALVTLVALAGGLLLVFLSTTRAAPPPFPFN